METPDELKEMLKAGLTVGINAYIDKLHLEWVSVNDRLPEVVDEINEYQYTKKALALDENGIACYGYFRINNYDNSRTFIGFRLQDSFEGEIKVSHWLEIKKPETPKEAENGE